MKQRRTQQRRDEILALATDTGLTNVEDLAERFGVTASTIRRDLATLSSDGRLARTYGGAISTSHLPEASLLQRRSEALDAKRDEVGETRRGAAALLARELHELIDVERRDTATRR